jgi:hypothetical protein
VSPMSSAELKAPRDEPKGHQALWTDLTLGFVIDRPVLVQDAALGRQGLGGREHRLRASTGEKVYLNEQGRWLMRIPPFRNSTVSINKDEDCSGIMNLPHRRLRRPQRQQKPWPVP